MQPAQAADGIGVARIPRFVIFAVMRPALQSAGARIRARKSDVTGRALFAWRNHEGYTPAGYPGATIHGRVGRSSESGTVHSENLE
jgi:hypothetical protein